MNQLKIFPTPSNTEKDRKNILLPIQKRRKVVQRLIIRSEALKIQLDALKREYAVKIGKLVAKDNSLDLDIIRSRNILRLMESGSTYEEAVEKIKETFYAEQLEIDKENENVRRAEERSEKANNEQSTELKKNARELWKGLIGLFHPDLTTDPQEKKRRENIMRQINIAYEEGDITRLTRIENEHTIIDETSIAKLEDILVSLENEILEQEKQYILLKESEWYKWHIKITKRQQTIQDIFSDVEKKLLDDIVAKLEILRELKKKIETLK